MGPSLVDTRGLPFQRLRDGGYYYVDKTLLIKDILDTNPEGVYLYTRPRRFGKSTNISMLDAFFNIEYEGNTWFDGLDISRHPECDVHKNAYPVISLSLSRVVSDRFEEFLGAMRTVIAMEFKEHSCLLEPGFMDPSERRLYDSLLDGTATENMIRNSIWILSRMLERYYGRTVVILIDEYDRAVTDAFDSEEQERMVGFLGNLLSSALKDNDSLHMAYITGVMQVAKAGMFSGLNNITVNNLFSTESDERFGFTEAEVRSLLNCYGHPEKFDEVKRWYDGYRFGDAEVYNPYSIMCYIRERFRPKQYWVNTSRDVPMRWLIRNVHLEDIPSVANLINGRCIVEDIRDSMTFSDIRMHRIGDLYSLMVLTGYLKAVPTGTGSFELSIPNEEVRIAVDDILAEDLRTGDAVFGRFGEAVLHGDAACMAETLGEILANGSYYSLRDESSYENILLTLMHGLLGDYEVRAESESGNGRADLILTPVRGNGIPIIMELKTVGSESALEAEADGALAQIRDRRYYLGMRGRVLLVGLAFWGKVPAVRTQVLEIP